MAHSGSRNVDLDPPEYEISPERKCGLAVIRQAILDACSMTSEVARQQHDGSKARYWRRRALMWFQLRSYRMGGWGWWSDVLDFSPDYVRKVERLVFADRVVVHPFVPKAQAALRIAGQVKKAKRKTAGIVAPPARVVELPAPPTEAVADHIADASKMVRQLAFDFCDTRAKTPRAPRVSREPTRWQQSALF